MSKVSATLLLSLGAMHVFTHSLRAEVEYFHFDNCLFTSGQPIQGLFRWTWDPGDFENGLGEMLYLDPPHTNHDHTDLLVSFDLNQIEITLEGNWHDDGVDIMMVLAEDLHPDGPAMLDTAESSYDIGGNGFYSGGFLAGQISPLSIDLQISLLSATEALCTWSPAVAGTVLQSAASPSAATWITEAPGDAGSAVVPLNPGMRFLRVHLP